MTEMQRNNARIGCLPSIVKDMVHLAAWAGMSDGWIAVAIDVYLESEDIATVRAWCLDDQEYATYLHRFRSMPVSFSFRRSHAHLTDRLDHKSSVIRPSPKLVNTALIDLSTWSLS